MNAVENEIEHWYYNENRMFVGAAGTTECWFPQNNVVFPAEMAEVLAVSAAERDGSRPCGAHYGPELDVIAYHRQPTTGSAAWGSNPVSVELSSHASAVVAGIAALVRSREQSLTNWQVMNRIIGTAGSSCSMPTAWHRLVNAEAAVGGICGTISGPGELVFTNDTSDPAYMNYTVSISGGIGPIEFEWWFGERTQTVSWAFANLGYDYQAAVSVRIWDRGTSNPARIVTKLVNVYDRTCVPVPPQIQCEWNP